MTRPNVGLGFKRYQLNVTTTAPAEQTLSGFDRGFGVILRYGAPFIEYLELVGEGGTSSLRIDRFELRDGWKLPAPGGFKQLKVRYRDGVSPNSSRVVLDVYLVPGMIEAQTDPHQGFASRRAFPATAGVHAALGGANQLALGGGAGTVVLVAEVIRDLYQEEFTAGSFPSGGNAFYGSRYYGADGSQCWPTPSLYFDGFLTASLASIQWKVWIMACRMDSNQLPSWVVYRELSPVIPATAVPAGILQDAGLSICRLENTTIPMAIPPDGFQIWVENLDANAKQLKGVIGGRSA
jgi:hypothetical protein